jgi:cytidylate kinase
VKLHYPRRLVKVFWGGSYEEHAPGPHRLDPDRMVQVGEQLMREIAQQGKYVIVGRGAPYFLRERTDSFHVFLYAPRQEKIRRIQRQDSSLRHAEDLVDSIDRERMHFIK